MDQAQHERQGQSRLELVDVPERRQPPVQPALHDLVERRPERAAVPGEQHQRRHEHGQHEPSPLGQVPPGESGEPQPGRERRTHDHDDRRGHGPARGQPRLTEVQIGDPVPGAAQCLGRRHGVRGGLRGLDVRQEVLAVDPEQQQRHPPPGRHDDHGRGPPGDQLALPGSGRPGQQIKPDRQQ